MSHQVSTNTRYLLWRKGVPRDQWEGWLVSRTSLGAGMAKSLVAGRLPDEQLSTEALRDVARALASPYFTLEHREQHRTVDGDNLVVLWEDDNGNRWYETVIKNGEVQW